MISVANSFKNKIFQLQNQDIKTRFTLKNLPIDGPTPSTRYLFNKSRQKTGSIINTTGLGSGTMNSYDSRFGINDNFLWNEVAEDFFEFNDDAKFNKVYTTTSSYTFSFWIKFEGTTTNFFTLRADNSNYITVLMDANKSIHTTILDGGALAGQVVSTINAITADKLHHVVITRSGADPMIVYVDGVNKTATTNTAYANKTFTNHYRTGFVIAGFNTGEFKLYALTYWDGTALSAQQVTQHFNAGAQNANVFGQDVDVSNYVVNSGSISRKLSYDIGKMSPTNVSITLMDDRENKLFLSSQKFAKNFWEGKGLEIDMSEDGDTWINLFTGIISSKNEDLKNARVTITAKDLSKQMTDLQVCTTIEASEVFTYSDTTFEDTRSFQQFIKYGKHAFVKPTTDNKGLNDRNDPFSGELAFRNIGTAETLSKTAGGNQTSGFLWYLPSQNKIDTTNSLIIVKVWDYFNNQWLALDILDRNVITDANVNGFYIRIGNPSLSIRVDNTPATFTWTQYLAGSNGVQINDQPDPAISVSFQSLVAPANPINILFDLLVLDRFGLELTLSEIDISADPSTLTTGTADVKNFTWDKAWSFFEGETTRINTDFKSQTSLMAIINEITKVTGLEFVVLGKKSSSLDRRVRVFDNSPPNTCAGFTKIELNVSNNDFVINPSVQTSLDTIKNTVLIDNFDSGKSSKDSFDTKKATGKPEGDIEKVLSLQSKRVYFYNSGPASKQVASRYLNRLRNSTEIYSFSLNKAGLTLEAGDIVNYHNNLTDQTRELKILESNYNLNDKKTRFKAKRHVLDFGPSDINRTALWAYYGDCGNYNVGPDGETYHYF